MTILPKVQKPTPKEEAESYDIANDRDHGMCVKCRRGPSVERDHRKNRSQGGLTLLSNLQLLCTSDHLWKTNHPRLAVEEGWAVPAWGDPAEWPARRYVQTDRGYLRLAWVLYDDLGGWEEIPTIEAFERMGRL